MKIPTKNLIKRSRVLAQQRKLIAREQKFLAIYKDIPISSPDGPYSIVVFNIHYNNYGLDSDLVGIPLCFLDGNEYKYNRIGLGVRFIAGLDTFSHYCGNSKNSIIFIDLETINSWKVIDPKDLVLYISLPRQTRLMETLLKAVKL